jgi:hypothetical protein
MQPTYHRSSNKERDMALNGSGIRDTARLLGMSTTTVMETLKKSPALTAVNEAVLAALEPTQTIVRLCKADEPDLEVEVDAPVEFCALKGATTLVMVGD